MADEIYCKYCHRNWKSKIEYDKHIRCCEYFYQQRRTPSPPEMTETGVPIPNMRRLYQYVQELTYRLEKTEKEVKRLRSELNSRKKHEVLVWLNQPSQTPENTFDEWVRAIKATESDMIKSLNGTLTDGILACLWANLGSSSDNGVLPIRCFSQKPGSFYVYSSAINGDASVTTEWRSMRPDQFMKLMNHIAKSIKSEFRIWNTAQIDSQEYDQNFMDKMPKYVKKLNADIDKLSADIKKSLFSKLQENLMVIVDC
jgi:hypothetical protein